MAGRHVRSEAALEALSSPASKAAVAAVAVGAMFGLAMPASGDADGASGARALAELSSTTTEKTTVPAATESFTAPQVEEDTAPTAEIAVTESADSADLSVTLPEPEPVAEEEEPAEAALVREAETQEAVEAPQAVAQTQVVDVVEETQQVVVEETEEVAAPVQQAQPVAQTRAAAPVQQAQAAAPVQQVATAPVAASGIGASIVATARQYAGVPYVYGGATPAGFDCSGFVSYVYHQLGLSMPRTTGAMAASYRRVSAAEARPGDLVMWGTYHVGIYTGNGMHIAAHRPGKPLSEGPLYGSYYFLRAY